ncbi:hypothetical protein VQ056_06035 [Paenibacillus sp. JTLBN-2024]
MGQRHCRRLPPSGRLLEGRPEGKGDRLILVSDAVSLGGMPPGNYDVPVGGRVTLTAQGRLHLAGQPALLAGSALPLTTGISHMRSCGICSLGEAWDMASTAPSKLMPSWRPAPGCSLEHRRI